ncbi:hypothetical protein [Pseudomonas sp. AA-38]|uniref:hypothetical protein n=1 Tax=Pseudomonas sp. AA-38 TaxID=3028807 RepID=UPI0023F89EE0|nr:hypothetical protein [Pseudomonas sp. AA-38]
MDEHDRRNRRAESFQKFINSLKEESDRGCVIVSAAILDDILSQLLKRRLAPSLEKKDELLDDGSAAFSTFSARINLAYRVGLVRSNVRATLHLLRKIRNDFAHISDPKTFDSHSVKSRVHEIFTLNKEIMDSFSESMIDHGLSKSGNSNLIEVFGTRSAYEFLIASAAAFLLDAVNDVEHIEPLE